MQFLTLLPTLLAVGSAFAASTNVIVGNNGTLTFTPSSITAAPGDLINFVFVAGNHSVTQSSFGTPCENISTGGLDSGFQFIQPGATMAMQFTIMVNDTNPLWFYCRQTNPKVHCQNGMVFAVNPTAEKSFSAFQQAAMQSANQTTTNSTSSSSSASSSGTSSASATGSSAGSASTAAVTSSAGTSASSAGSSPSPTTTPNSAGTVKLAILS
ncbi:Cupredoxin [Cytidiella melzeri]|nr:Cupredoxin [Cytidiella melzeri]